jgi:NIPSNAP
MIALRKNTNSSGIDSILRVDKKETSMTLNCWRFKGWIVCGIALASFAAGSLITAQWMHVNAVRADSNRVFELRVYHAVPGKLPALESRFRDTTSRLLAKHNLNVVGYWVPEGAHAWDNTFVDITAYPSREEAKKNWDAMMADPEFQEVLKSEQATKLVETIDSTYMRPTDFSPMK